jgi:hypothetical protein
LAGSIKPVVVYPNLYSVFDGLQLEESNFYSCWRNYFLNCIINKKAFSGELTLVYLPTKSIIYESVQYPIKLDAIRRNTETITFRLDNDTLEKIRNVAKSENTSTNALVNKILESYIQWELDAPQAGWALMPKLV